MEKMQNRIVKLEDRIAELLKAAKDHEEQCSKDLTGRDLASTVLAGKDVADRGLAGKYPAGRVLGQRWERPG